MVKAQLGGISARSLGNLAGRPTGSRPAALSGVLARAMLAALTLSGTPQAAAGADYIAGKVGVSVGIVAAGAAYSLDDPANRSTGPFAGLSVNSLDDPSPAAFAASIRAGADLAVLLRLPFRAELEYTVRGKRELTSKQLFAGRPSVLDALVENETLMLNVMWDTPWTLWRFRPFIGAGIGQSYVKVRSARVGTAGGAEFEETRRETTLAWSPILGAAMGFGNGWALDLRYRYLPLGEVAIGPVGPNNGATALDFGDLTAHEFGFGLRYLF